MAKAVMISTSHDRDYPHGLYRTGPSARRPKKQKHMQIDGFDDWIHRSKKLFKNIFFKKFFGVSIPSILSNV
jgi:hypothetical protein